MRVLVGCEESGRVRDAFKARDHDAWSCDLKPTAVRGQHLQCNVLDILDEGWDLAIFHPVCTRLANSGVKHLFNGMRKENGFNPEKMAELDDGATFFNALWRAPIPRVAVENPIQHRYARERIGDRPMQIIQPWMFGHMESKATCLWLRGLPKLVPMHDVRAEMMRLPINMPPGPLRAQERSRTLPGVAAAFAAQWG